MTISSLLRALCDLAVPHTCLVCGCSLTESEEGSLCLDCLLKLPRTGMHTTPTASRGLNAVQERLADGPPLLLGGAWFYYSRNSPYAELVRAAKYHDRPSLARKLGELYGRELLQDLPDLAAHVDLLLPVGMHWFKEMRRGYNQSAEIAAGLSRATGIPVGDNLRALRSHATQTRRNAEERRRNISGIFGIDRPEEIRGLNVAIVDDVITSGATAAEVARTVLRAGAATASLLALGLTSS